MKRLSIGTCSWKYDSWKGIVYSDHVGDRYLAEYARRYPTVEIDQWYWSLIGVDTVKLPDDDTSAQYATSVPDDFRFGIKLPDALTLTHFRPEKKGEPTDPNPHFLSKSLMVTFLRRIRPIEDRLGPLMLQFGYLNRQMMPSQDEFLRRLGVFAKSFTGANTLAVEIRNPNYLNEAS